MSQGWRERVHKGVGCGRKYWAGQGRLAGLCVDAGFHGMSEAFELRSGYDPSCLLADPLGLLCGGEREPGKKQKDG